MNKLKEAEKEASQMVATARKDQSKRMNEAKIEADQVVANYRSELEGKYNEAHARIQNNAGQSSSEITSKTSQEISTMNQDFVKKKVAIEDALVDLVCKVDNSDAGKRQ